MHAKAETLLFADRETLARVPDRPLGAFSTYVVLTMPHDLAAIRAGKGNIESIVAKSRILLESTRPFITTVLDHPLKRDLAGLDLKMLESGIVHLGGEPPEELTQTVDRFSASNGQPAGLTYEEIIMINPFEDRRTFTVGEVGRTEADFYEIHRLIEVNLDVAIGASRSAIALLSQHGDIAAAVDTLKTAQAVLEPVVANMHSVGNQMDPEIFGEFRPYLTTHPVRGLKGPSGAFTAGVPTLELLLTGETLPAEYISYLAENRDYFPREGRENIAQALELAGSGLSLRSLCESLGMPESLVQGLRDVSQQIRSFRGKHYQGVRNQVPEAINGNVSGTGGESDVKSFLHKRAKIRHI